MKHRGAWGLLLCALAGCGDRVGDTTPEARGSLLGRVLLAPDVPAAAARVVVTGTGQGAIANAAGEFERGGLRPGRYQLMASAAESGDYVPRRFQAGVTAGGIANLETIVLGKPGAIGGRILNAELADLTLAIVGIDGTGIVTAPSDRRAYVLQAVPPGVHDVTLVTPMGVIVKRGVRVTPGRTTTGVDLDLAQVKAASGSLEGVAVRVEDGPSASGGIGVELRSALTGALVGTAVKTSADGSFSLPVPRQGAYAVRATSGERHVTVGGVLFAGGQQRLLTRLVIPLLDDLDGDGKGAADDDDDDGDGVPDAMDAFDDDFAESVDADGDGLGDEADLATMGSEAIDVKSDTPDSDGDGRFDFEDNCVMRPNPTQEDVDQDAVGDACDNCPRSSNPEQQDGDMDDVGDACPPSTVTCATRGARCGLISDGAGVSIDCGMCPMGQSCGAGGRANQCAPTCPTAVSCPVGRCGSIPDGCGGTLACGGCTLPSVCGASGTCEPCAGLRTCAVDECGSGPDGCGLGRTLTCAATCPGTQTCGGAGTPNRCGVGMNQLQVGAGQDQTGFIGQRLAPVVVQVTRGGTPIVGAAVTVTTQDVGATFLGSDLQTDTAGQVSFTPILGLVAGPYRWQVVASAAAGGGSVDVTARADAPVGAVAGTVVPVVNAIHLPGTPSSVVGVASQSRPSANLYDLEVAADGTVYFSDAAFNAVYAVSTSGEVRRIAGAADGSAGSSGDFGAATAALLSGPNDLALDGNRLYIADSGNRRIRVIDDLSAAVPVIQTFAGGGTGDPDAVEGLPATSAALDQTTQLQVASDGALVFSDRSAVRRVDRATRAITTLLPSSNCFVNDGKLANCSGERCRFARDGAGLLYVAGPTCTGNTGSVMSIVRYEADGTQVHIAGGSATPASGDPALGADIGDIRGLAFDRAGQLFFSNVRNQIWRIDRVGRLELISGGAGSGGDFGPASAARWQTPRGLGFRGDDLYVVDAGNASIRMIGQVGRASQQITVAAVSAAVQTTQLGRALPAALSATVTEGTTPLPRVRLGVRALQPGAAVLSPLAITDVSGVASGFVRASLTPGMHMYELSLRDIQGRHVTGSPVLFPAMATAPTGTTFYAVNAERVADFQSVGPSTLLRIHDPRGIAVHSDGTVYVADRNQHAVLAISSAGLVSVLAGVPLAQGFGGEGAAAVQARLDSPDGLALDEVRKRLYVADTGNHRVRYVELDGARRIHTVAGGGSAPPPGDGDGGQGVQATLISPSGLALEADGTLWIWGDMNRLRRLDTASGIITGLDIGYRSTRPFAPDCYTHVDGCRLAIFDGKLLMSANIGNGGGAPFNGVLEIDRSTGVTAVFAGAPGGMTFDQLGALAVDASGNKLVLVDNLAHRMYSLARGTTTFTPIFGDGTLGSAGDYVSPTMAAMGGLAILAFDAAGHLWFSDPGNHAVRVIW
ncbi:MAG: hypothetical protein IT370_28520 [Deltaproteobacteria bacterium]|nr:hypothetical protein [Deltaproteobacteria bacterium]